jgi:conjugative relaxase-like TrwC/TraI family protein
MLRVRTIYASTAQSAAAYYTRYLTDAPGEVPGVWTGDQAVGLGLAGEVDGEDLLAVLEGRDPGSGTPLGRLLTDRTLANGRVVKAVAGFDATFSAPKSLSVLWALTQDDRLLAAHDTAVRAALAHLERFGSTTRVRRGGRLLHPDSQGLTMAMFRQTTSRSDDPQLHTHVVISAKVQTDDGRWLALDARYLKGYQRMLGGLYQSVLRNELTHRFGIGWEPIVHGQAEILGVPEELREVFSKRSEQIDHAVTAKVAEFVSRQGRDPNQWELAAIKREAAVDTRSHKSGNGVAELVTRWQTEAAIVGWDGLSLIDAVTEAGREQPTEPQPVSIDEIVTALSTGGSTWNRANIISALCDVARPDRRADGERWAEVIERAVDRIVERCVKLDPDHAAAPRRRSDGRSMWLEPTSPHITTDEILREEELVLAWALEAHADDPTPSTTVETQGLDVLQADAAAAVAGHDRLVLVVGPAGAGKTTMLRAAIDDLTADGRAVFGVAPSAKAARVLERETGVPADTLAKLLHERHRDDRPPLPRYQLPAGTTVLVDEAGMVSTPALARLVTRATEMQWRLALVGDPYQLQAVGRGGLFHELCTTGRTHELAKIHRFTEPWEAAASLQLRRGDPAALDAYIAHGRVHAAPFDEHVALATQRWLDATAAGEVAAVIASTNQHVDALNAAIQRARHLDPAVTAAIGGGETVMVGDQIVTRRNNRTITTSTGDAIRNRELWTVDAIIDDGSLTVSPIRGHGTATLPADYARQHVRLGYAATEHGVQGDTVTDGIELATEATSRRGLYVALTRGQRDNTVLVVTDTHDIVEARDILERILTNDRVDLPATAQRRELATTDCAPQRPEPTPRCTIPDWLPDLKATIRTELAAAEQAAERHDEQRADLEMRLAQAKQRLAVAERGLDPYRPALAAAHADATAAQERIWTANNLALRSKGRHKRRAQNDARTATADRAAAQERQHEIEDIASPARQQVHAAATEVHQLEQSLRSQDVLDRWHNPHARADHLRELHAAVYDWQQWAAGRAISLDRVATIAATLGAADEFAGTHPLADVLHQWAAMNGVEIRPPQASTQGPSIELGL